MREILYKQRQTHTEDGQPLHLSYLILMNKGTDGRNRYGVKVRSNYDDAVATDLSERSERAFDLLDKLARNTVTPTGLPDVLVDWRG